MAGDRGGGASEGLRERERENSDSKTLILEDSSVRPVWLYPAASPCYTTNTSTTILQIPEREREREEEEEEEEGR